MTHALQELRPLTDDERLQAADQARNYIVKSYGHKPRREQFLDVTVSKYPRWVTKLVAVMMAVVFIAAAMPSLFRIYTAGHTYFMHGINDSFQASIVGVATFLLAEFLVILSTISMRIYFEGRARWLFVVPISLGLAMTFVGNWVIAQPADIFGLLETLAPPVAVLFLAITGERIILDSIQSRHANEIAFKEALRDWQAATAEPEKSTRWKSAYANALKEAIYQANRSGAGSTARKELMNGMKASDWRPLVIREMRAENWFDDVEVPAAIEVKPVPNPTIAPPQPVTIHQNGNGHGARATRSEQ